MIEFKVLVATASHASALIPSPDEDFDIVGDRLPTDLLYRLDLLGQRDCSGDLGLVFGFLQKCFKFRDCQILECRIHNAIEDPVIPASALPRKNGLESMSSRMTLFGSA